MMYDFYSFNLLPASAFPTPACRQAGFHISTFPHFTVTYSKIKV